MSRVYTAMEFVGIAPSTPNQMENGCIQNGHIIGWSEIKSLYLVSPMQNRANAVPHQRLRSSVCTTCLTYQMTNRRLKQKKLNWWINLHNTKGKWGLAHILASITYMYIWVKIPWIGIIYLMCVRNIEALNLRTIVNDREAFTGLCRRQ